MHDRLVENGCVHQMRHAYERPGWFVKRDNMKMKPYDYMALVPVIEGAGGTVCDWTGKPLGIASDGHVLAAANIETRDEALQYLNP